jgi:hypothetical protein
VPLRIILYVAASWCGACNLHALQTVEQSFYLSFLNDNLVFNIYQPNVFKELAHLVSGQGLSKAVGDYIISGRVDHPNLPALYFLSQLVVVDINVSEFGRQLGGVLIDQPDCLFVVALDRDR